MNGEIRIHTNEFLQIHVMFVIKTAIYRFNVPN